MPFQASATTASKPSIDLLCKWFLCNDNTANLKHHLLYIDLLRTFFTPFLQVFNLGRFISQKHNNKDTNWKTTQQQLQITRKLGKADNYEIHKIKIYTSPNLLKDNHLNLKAYYWSRYFLNPACKTL